MGWAAEVKSEPPYKYLEGQKLLEQRQAEIIGVTLAVISLDNKKRKKWLTTHQSI